MLVLQKSRPFSRCQCRARQRFRPTSFALITRAYGLLFCRVVAVAQRHFFVLMLDQTLFKSKQLLIDFIHIVVSPFDKIFYNDITEFART